MPNGIESRTNGITRGTNGDGLLSCPFCGGWAYVHEHYLEHFGFSVGCRTVDCRGKRENTGFTYKTKAEAIAAWNTRADDAATAEMAQRIQSLELECAKLQKELRKEVRK